MVFGSSKKATQKELRGKIEGILSILKEMTPSDEARQEGAGDVSKGGQALDFSDSTNALKKTVDEIEKRTTAMVAAQERLHSEYKKFVDDCQPKDDLSEGGRYQLASDFFSYLVAESAKGRKEAESLGHDFAKLSENLDKFVNEAEGTSGAPGGDIAQFVDKARQALVDLASFLSVELTEPSEKKSE